ncbi:protein FAM83B [Pleuronectes platessa]|uniref:protein FAM83B n=1 Tax=Pleuronectes platessa TaxID=8262 RepID=UPI00232A540D|nr:protein FAM83B [Pleuronectes platessa]XP_053291892.1 protein FAM83B [Pleuronectes platessa]
MESPEFSMLSSLRGEIKSEDYIQPHYKETYRLAIDRLVSDGRDSYQEFLKGERIGSFLSEDELLFITSNAEQLPPQKHTEEKDEPSDSHSSSGTYWPLHSDVETPDLDLGWPDVIHEKLQTNIDLLFHPPRLNSPSIKDTIRKRIQEARQVIAIVMDVFTDVDIFKEIVDATVRGVSVYVLLDDSHLKCFLTMAENHDVKIQQLRNMRVRTVKGPDYHCRSGAKFHGAMEQKFLLVDCHTAIYGSYSFTWSFEKINLSMVQVITGHLVKMYDEEFRTLYARSTVPANLGLPECSIQLNGPNEQQILPASHSAQQIERRDVLRHTLDTVYRKTCERKLGQRDYEKRLLEEEPNHHGPLFENGLGGQNQMSHLQSAEVMNHLKRHSYAGERQDGYTPQHIQPRGSHWNVSRETGNRINYPTDNHVPQIYRGQNIYNDGDKHILSMQQNMPTLENTSKSFMRTLRIESYLNNPDAPYGDSCDYLDQFEPRDIAGSFMQGRTRSSYALRPPIPEHMDPNRAAPHTPLQYTSMQWKPTAACENRINKDEFIMKSQSSQILDDNRNIASYGPERNSYQSPYTSLGRAKGGHMMTNPGIMTDSWQKRHSLADPRSDTEYGHESSGHMYGAFARMPINRSTAGINAQNGAYVSNMNEEQRSVSHYDVKSIKGTKGPSTPNWQESPCRTVSAAALDMKSRDLMAKANSKGSQPFLQMGSKNAQSMLNISEKKEDLVRNIETLSITSGASTDTLTAEDEGKISDGFGKLHRNKSSPVRSSSEQQRKWSKDRHTSFTKPQLRTEEHKQSTQVSIPDTSRKQKSTVLDKSVRPSLDTDSWTKNRGAEGRLYSRYEPFCSIDKKDPLYSPHGLGSTRSQEKTKSPPKAEADANLSRATRGHHENKLEKFFNRVGHLLHKNKY